MFHDEDGKVGRKIEGEEKSNEKLYKKWQELILMYLYKYYF
jgi:hypothetical protein